MGVTRSGRTVRSLGFAAALLSLAVTGAGCPRKVRIKGDTTAPSQTTGEAAKKAQVTQKEEPLPPPTMSPREMRLALWDIAARQHKGEAKKALDDYADRFQTTKTLETRFLAAAAIPDLESQWDSVHEISTKQPKFYWGHAQMAAIYAEWKVRDQCEKELNIAFQLAPEIPYSYTVRGKLYRNIGEYNLAVRDYATALRADPSDADARVGLAIARKALGNDSTYEAELQKALSDVPTEYEAAESLAILYDQQNRTKDALAAWQKVADLMPKNRSARLALARLAGDQDPASAIKAYEEAAKIQPLSKVEEQALASLYQEVNRTDDEVKALVQVTKLDPKDIAPWRRLAAIYEQKNSLPDMESTYRSILALDGKDTAALMGIARIAEKRAMIRQAIDGFREAQAAGEAKAEPEIARLREACRIPAKPVTGASLTTFYRAALDSLEKEYTERLKDAPALKGSIRAKIHSDREGKALSVDIVENTTSDPYLEAHLYYVLLEATWPKLKPSERDTFTLKFDLPPEKN